MDNPWDSVISESGTFQKINLECEINNTWVYQHEACVCPEISRAVHVGFFDGLELALSLGQSPNTLDENGSSLLSVSIYESHHALKDALLAASTINPNIIDMNGDCSLHIASRISNSTGGFLKCRILG